MANFEPHKSIGMSLADGSMRVVAMMLIIKEKVR
jgi:hypothetical protein